MSDADQNSIIDEVNAQFENEEIGTRDTSIAIGEAVLRCTNCFLTRSKGKGRKTMVAECIIVQHEEDGQEGKTYQKRWGLENPQNLAWLNGDLHNLDLEVLSAKTMKEDLARVVTELLGKCFIVALVENADTQYPPNAFINKGARRYDLETEEVAF